MKPLLPAAALSLLLLAHHAFGQAQTPPPFPGWANKNTTANATSDKKGLLGEWQGFVTDGDGSNPGQRRMNINLTITADKITSGGQGTVGEGTYRVSAGSGKLQHLDATGTSGQYQGKLYEGVFTVEGNTLKWCSGNPGKGRPSDLRTNPAAGHFLVVLTRRQ